MPCTVWALPGTVASTLKAKVVGVFIKDPKFKLQDQRSKISSDKGPRVPEQTESASFINHNEISSQAH